MKITKCTSVFLSLLILVSNVGMAFNVHFCGGQIAGVSSFYYVEVQSADSIHQCCVEKAKEKKSCCKDRIVKLNKKSDFTSKVFSFEATDAAIVSYQRSHSEFMPAITKGRITSYYCDANSPPLFKLYSQYIFYA